MIARKILRDIHGKVIFRVPAISSVYKIIEEYRKSSLKLEDLDFRCCELPGIQMNGFWLHGSDFSDSCLVFSNFSACRLNDCDFNESNLDQANMSGSNFSYAKFRNASMRYSNLRNGYLNNTDFYGADMTGCDLRGCKIIDCDFKYADLRGALIDPESFAEVDMSFVRITQEQKIEILNIL